MQVKTHSILVDDSAEKIMSVYDEAFDLSGFARLRPAPQGVARQRAIGWLAILRISHTVEAATATPSSVSSPWMRRYPHEGFSVARRRTRRRIEATVRGRPDARFTLKRAWRRCIKSRCHLSTVSGLTKSRSRRSVALARGTSKAANNALSSGRSRGR